VSDSEAIQKVGITDWIASHADDQPDDGISEYSGTSCVSAVRLHVTRMKLSLIQNLALQARIAAVVGAEEFDRLFAGVDFAEVEDCILYIHAADSEAADEIEDSYSAHIAKLATGILRKEIEFVMVFPKVYQ
jgi:hypothetical protein